MKSRAIVIVGTVLYVLAWFVPVHNSLPSSVLPGWEAFTTALWPYGSSDPWYAGLHFVASAVSNFFLVGALVLVFVARRSPPRFLRAIIVASAVLNTHWFVLSESRSDLRIGYYLWAGSFFLIATGLFMEARGGGSSRSQAV